MSDVTTPTSVPSNAQVTALPNVEAKPIPGRLQIPDGANIHQWEHLHKQQDVKPADQIPAAKPVVEATPPADPAVEGEQQADAPAVSATDLEALQRFREWENSEDLPKEFLTKKIEVPTEHGPVYETIEGLKKGFMRRTDFHRSMDEMKAKESQYNARLAEYDQVFQDVRDPQRFVEEYEENNYDLEAVAEIINTRKKQDTGFALAAARQVAEQIARELRAENIDDPRVYNHRDVQRAYDEAIAQRRDFRNQQREMTKQKRELEKLKQGQTQQQHTVAEQQQLALWKRQLDQFVPRSFKAHGVPHNKSTEATFTRFLGSLMDSQGTKTITPELVQEATIMAKEELDDIRAKEQRLTPQPQPNVVGPQRLGAGGKIPAPSNRQPVSVESLEARLRPQRGI